MKKRISRKRRNSKSPYPRAMNSKKKLSPVKRSVKSGARKSKQTARKSTRPGLMPRSPQSPRRSITRQSPERSFYPDSLNETDFYANNASFSPRNTSPRRSFGNRRSSFGLPPNQSSMRKNALRRSQLFGRMQGGQLSPIKEGAVSPVRRLSPASESFYPDSLNPTLVDSHVGTASRNNSYRSRYSPHNITDTTKQLNFTPPSFLSSPVKEYSINETIPSVLADSLNASNSFMNQTVLPKRKSSPINNDQKQIRSLAKVMRRNQVRNNFDVKDFLDLGYTPEVVSAALSLSTELPEHDLSNIQILKENEMLIDSLAVEMAREHINDTFDIRNYYARDIPYEVIYPAYELSFKLKKDYIKREEEAELKELQRRYQLSDKKIKTLKRGGWGKNRTPGLFGRKTILKAKIPMQQTISPSDVCQILLDEYKKGNYDPNKLLKNQFKIKNCNKKIYDKAKWFFKIIMDIDQDDDEPEQTEDNPFKSPTYIPMTYDHINAQMQRRMFHGGRQFTKEEVKNMQAKFADMYEGVTRPKYAPTSHTKNALPDHLKYDPLATYETDPGYGISDSDDDL